MGQKNTTSTTNTSPNPVAGAAYTDLLSRAAGVASTPYQSYTGELVAPVNAQQTAGINNINQNAGFAQPYIQQAAGYANSAAQPLTAEDIARYSDPFTQQVIDATQSQFNNQNAQQQQGVIGNAAAQGALGGNRVGVAQAELAGQQQRAQAPIIAGLRSQGYNTGLNTAMNQQQQRAQAAYSLGNLGVAGQNAALTGANAQVGAGTLQQGTSQALDAAQYNQFLQSLAFPYQQTQWLSGIDTGVGSQLGGTSQTTKPGPSALGQIAGLGLAGAGLFMGNPWMVGAGLGGSGVGGGGESGTSGGGGPFFYRGGRIAGFDGGGPVMPYGSSVMPYGGAGPSVVPQAQMAPGRPIAGVGAGMDDQPSPGVSKMIQDATALAQKFMGSRYGGAVEPPSSDSIMVPRGFAGGGMPTMAGFGDGSMVPSFNERFAPTYDAINSGEFDPVGMNFPPPEPLAYGDVPMPRGRPQMAGVGAMPPEMAGAPDGAGFSPTEGGGDEGGEGDGPTAGFGQGIGPALMSAGFGMMASQSPHIGTAIGEGGLAGLKTYTTQQQQEIANKRAESTIARQAEQSAIQRKSVELRAKQLSQDAERHAAELAERTKRHADTLALREKQLQQGRMPPGFRAKDDGTFEAIPGGPHDPTVIAAQSKAKLPGAGDFNTDLTGDEFLATLSPGDRGLIKKLANYEIDPKTLSTRGGEREAALRKVAQYDPSFDQKRYNTIYNAVNKFATGKQGDTVRSFNVGIAHLDTLEGLIGALNNKDLPAFNRLANYVRTQTGHEAPGNFDAARDIVGKEIVKAVVGAGGGVEERREVAERMAAAKSPQQLLGVINTYKELMSGQVRGIKKQYEDATGLKNFEDKLMPETIRQLNLHDRAPPKVGDERQFKQGIGVWDGTKWAPKP